MVLLYINLSFFLIWGYKAAIFKFRGAKAPAYPLHSPLYDIDVLKIFEVFSYIWRIIP